MKKLAVLLGSLVLLLTALPAASAQKSDAALGERIVRELFADPATAKLAKGFQSVHQDGARDRDAELKTVKALNIRDYTLANFKVTREGNVLIVTYTFAGNQTIDGKPTSAEPGRG